MTSYDIPHKIKSEARDFYKMLPLKERVAEKGMDREKMPWLEAYSHNHSVKDVPKASVLNAVGIDVSQALTVQERMLIGIN